MLDPDDRFVELDTTPLSPLPAPPLLLPLLRPSEKHSDESLDALATAFEPPMVLSFAVFASFKSDER